MYSSEAKQLVQDSMKLRGKPTAEEYASLPLELIYTKIREISISGNSSYIFTLPVRNDKQLQFYTKVLGFVVADLHKNKFTVIPINKSFEIAIKIQW